MSFLRVLYHFVTALNLLLALLQIQIWYSIISKGRGESIHITGENIPYYNAP